MKQPDLEIRPFRLRHLTELMRLEREAFGKGAYTRAMFHDLHRQCGDLFLVALLKRAMAGYIVVCMEPPRAELVSIAVAERHRGKCIGEVLLRAAIDRSKAAGVRRLDLMVRTDNRVALRFYRKLGFVRVGRISRYYEDGTDAIRMNKRLRV